MIPLANFKKYLGPAASGMTDAEIEALLQWEYRFADAAFEWWQRGYLFLTSNLVLSYAASDDNGDIETCWDRNGNEIYVASR